MNTRGVYYRDRWNEIMDKAAMAGNYKLLTNKKKRRKEKKNVMSKTFSLANT